jgi:hypothetical protein
MPDFLTRRNGTWQRHGRTGVEIATICLASRAVVIQAPVAEGCDALPMFTLAVAAPTAIVTGRVGKFNFATS